MPKLFFTCVSSSEPVQGPTAIMGVYVNLGTLLLIPMAQPVQGPTASMGIYVNSGSIYESPRFSGSSALLECLAFKSTTHRSATRITSEVQCPRAPNVLGGRRLSGAQEGTLVATVVRLALWFTLRAGPPPNRLTRSHCSAAGMVVIGLWFPSQLTPFFFLSG